MYTTIANMTHEYCHFCFRTLSPREGKSVRCVSCGSIYHLEHFDDSCLECANTEYQSYIPQSNALLKNTIRKPVRLKSHKKDDWVLKDYVAWVLSRFRFWLSILVGIGLSTIVGAYTIRVLSIDMSDDLVSYLNNIIRDRMPSEEVRLVALLVSVLGAFIFFPARFPEGKIEHVPVRRFNRLIAILILLVALNLLYLGLDVNDLMHMVTSNFDITLTAEDMTILVTQCGALSVTFLIGFIIRRTNPPKYEAELSNSFIQLRKAVNGLWFYLSGLGVAFLASYVAFHILPSYRLISVPINWGNETINTNYAQLAILSTTLFATLLLYHAPKHNEVKLPGWRLRALGCAVGIAGFIYIYRVAPYSQLEIVLEVILITVITIIVLIPVQRGIS